MEGLNATDAVIKKPRSVAFRKPRSMKQLTVECNGICLPSRSARHDDDTGVEAGGQRRKELHLNSPEMKGSMTHRSDVPSKIRRDDKSGGDYDGHGRSRKTKDAAKHGSESVLALECTARNIESLDNPQLVPRDDSLPGENRPRKVKFKFNRTQRTKNGQDDGGSGIPATSACFINQYKQKDSGGHTTKDTHGNRAEGKHGNKHGNSLSPDLVCKSKRIPKKRTLDEDSDDGDGEIRYLQKLKGAKVAPDPVNTGHKAYDFVDDALKKKELTKLSKNKSIPYEVDEDFRMSRSGRNGRKKLGDDNEFIEDEESEMEEKSGLKKADSPQDVKIETPGLTTRQRALQSRGGNGESFIEFPDGLPAASSRKQKEKLSDVELQAKKAEAAQRRKMQVEKAEKEQQAEAMRKILGLDSEKKKEEKKLKERENREKQAKLEECKKNCVRTVMGPTGTVITFPESMGLPSIFNSKPVSYPPPREKCAGPSCTNPYKYRDSKTLLPLCSLACYKAVQGRPPDQGTDAAQGSGGGQESAGKQA
ncbi:HIT zinc finger isoform X2 [Zea mays]|uniref:HIT zinc finger n=2 Tax=Zea mays TaxID=4577 RepID=B7ZXG9_MAIZE|nr:HIT zinc finger [Zea mays]XP_008643447.1 HIT zinc finger isoform X2 [Zea mays]XP_020408858.1 HIT zinc finger isoform X2 [Zea mays]ACL52618.1 unknown [Zea mays]ACL52624.1 unknown [Zea mays]AQK62109.1 HIT zinc finger [Zea mays]AQK62110.1 HIT zinc finger [Zea mays]AQK62111.1 HIT zinc finger [Zea mays]|eukprot:NP_001145802.1 HIT zinc finger [Zea mays]